MEQFYDRFYNYTTLYELRAQSGRRCISLFFKRAALLHEAIHSLAVGAWHKQARE
ncbi:hypothetical protein [Methyloceanibacter superfactus]|uniref:hypothetical protein n=1 Tax=Methyloceanibacter superfactus TaxID=1774969 RepID=UPI0013010833|nr:hypothetical protein [Methyloceanibacter superfactus]